MNIRTISTAIHNRYKRLSSNVRHLLWLLLAGIVIAVPALISAPRYHITTTNDTGFYLKAPQTVPVDKIFTVELHVHNGNQSINAVGAVLKFNPKKLEIITMTTTPSFCSFYTENSFDTIGGEVRLSCGAPSPGFTGDSTLALINMRARSIGTDQISFSKPDAQILANDGKGTNIVGPLPSATVTIIQSL